MFLAKGAISFVNQPINLPKIDSKARPDINFFYVYFG